VAKVNEYRVYQLDKAGHVDGPADSIVWEGDEAAIEQAKRLVNGHGVEIGHKPRSGPVTSSLNCTAENIFVNCRNTD
jgi:hypothetical protein